MTFAATDGLGVRDEGRMMSGAALSIADLDEADGDLTH
jgi:hypothetical protein